MILAAARTLAVPRAVQMTASREMVRLRLARFGRKHRPFYRIVVADAKAPRDGRHIERVGTYDPIPAQDGIKEVRLNVQRIKYWLSVGAQPTKRVAWLLGKAEVLPPTPRVMPFSEARPATAKLPSPTHGA
ncbi:hypothetical protein CTAYLR_007191 [Chrysophaeum taylorii]|uniref:Ribosomal protein S16 n=1 Tax=Chrysophaeum taylorii TaxID=2483200 RepID=A0AAD7UMC7_9STRA|nr:hypothetical protein CTAYLR_007191 [Chrysophaeum taylorii]